MRLPFISIPRAALRVAAFTLVTCGAALSELPVYRIGLVVDGPDDRRQQILALMEAEIVELTGNEFDVRFPEEAQLLADGTPDGVRRAVSRLLADPAIDLVLGAGALASHVLAAEVPLQGPLPKPVMAPLIIDTELQGLSPVDGASGIANLSYTVFPSDPAEDLRTFQQVVSFDVVALAYPQSLSNAIPGLPEYYRHAAAAIGARALVLTEVEPDAILQSIPPDVGAVFFPLPSRFGPAAMEHLAQGLIERRLPGFATDTWFVEEGLLAGLHTQADKVRLARRTALNIQRLLLGEEAGSLPVFLGRGDRLTINMATARALGAYPSWAVMTEAVLIGQKRVQAGRLLTLTGMVGEAVAVNLDLAVGQRAVAVGAAQVREARAGLLPQLGLQAAGTAIGADQANAFQTERSLTTTGSVSQVLYSEAARANLDIERRLQRSRQLELDDLRLDIVEEAATAYLGLLRAITLERVQEQNVRLTRRNLELARVRVGIGVSGRAEVHRWESEIATARRSLIEANARRNVAEIAVNRILHRPLEEPFEVAEVGLHDDDLLSHDPRFSRYMASKPSFAILRDFLVDEGLAASPRLQVLDHAIGVRERILIAARRALYLPTLALRGDLTGNLARGGAGSETPPVGGDATWTLGLNASFPLYSGGGKLAGLTRVREELEQLRLQRQAVAERLEQAVRSAAHLAGGSYAGIRLSQDATVAAHRNLTLVEDAYGRGVLSILDLLDAQNAAIVAEEGSASAVYGFLADLMAAERAMGRFFLLEGAAEREAWFERADAFFAGAAAPATSP